MVPTDHRCGTRCHLGSVTIARFLGSSRILPDQCRDPVPLFQQLPTGRWGRIWQHMGAHERRVYDIFCLVYGHLDHILHCHPQWLIGPCRIQRILLVTAQKHDYRGTPSHVEPGRPCFLDRESACWASELSARDVTWNFLKNHSFIFWRSISALSITNHFFLDTIMEHLFADWSCCLSWGTSGSRWNIKLSSSLFHQVYSF